MSQRIELYEKYISNPKKIAYYDGLGVPNEKLIEYKYRRINPRIDEIDRIIEIPGNDKECEVLFYSREKVVVLANFDELCILFNDLENSNNESSEFDN
jgi:hypothetical protein